MGKWWCKCEWSSHTYPASADCEPRQDRMAANAGNSERRFIDLHADDRSVIRLYAEISLFSHSTTISLSPFVAKPRERSRAFPSFSEPLKAFYDSLRNTRARSSYKPD